MDEYIIGAGAILRAGATGGITPATLHAKVGAPLAATVRAAAIDFEGTGPATLSRLLVVLAGCRSGEFERVCTALRAAGTCDLADVLLVLANESDLREVHLFARWLPDRAACARLEKAGVALVAHPLESIERAALVAEQRHLRWEGPRAA